MAFAALQSGDGPMSENAPSPLSGSVASLAAHQPGRPISALVISGGSAANSVLDAFTGLFDNVSFVLPVSDNGGSSSEIIRYGQILHVVASFADGVAVVLVQSARWTVNRLAVSTS